VLLLSAGNVNDMTMAAALIGAAGPFERLIADRGYDTNAVRALIAEGGAEAVIPSTTSRRSPIPYDRAAYRARNLVERLWCRLKDWRRIATRYDKLGSNYLSAAIIAAAITFWANRVRTLARARPPGSPQPKTRSPERSAETPCRKILSPLDMTRSRPGMFQ